MYDLFLSAIRPVPLTPFPGQRVENGKSLFSGTLLSLFTESIPFLCQSQCRDCGGSLFPVQMTTREPRAEVLFDFSIDRSNYNASCDCGECSSRNRLR